VFRGRNRSIVTVTAVIEAGLAGWALGAGWLGLLVAVAAVTLADTLWGVARRGMLGDIAGLELAAALAVLLTVRADPTLSALTACACAAWLVRPERQTAFERVATSGRRRQRA
jgi:hypothetical protein